VFSSNTACISKNYLRLSNPKTGPLLYYISESFISFEGVITLEPKLYDSSTLAKPSSKYSVRFICVFFI